MDLISIIVPIYNVERYLKKCIDSLINQTYKNIEIILVNDGSKDNSIKICDEYVKSDNRIKLFHKENGGLADARNYGMKFVTGKYVTFVDSDDIISKNMIEILYNNLIENNAQISECEFFRFCNESEISNNINDSKKYTVSNMKDKCKALLQDKANSNVCGKLFLTELWNDIEFPKGKYYEDQFTFYKVLFKTNIIVHNKSQLYFYRRNPNSIVASMNKVKAADFIEATENMTDAIVKRYPEFKNEYINMNLITRLKVMISINKKEYIKNKDFYKNIDKYIKNNSSKIINNNEISKKNKIKVKLYVTNKKIGKFIINFWFKLKTKF